MTTAAEASRAKLNDLLAQREAMEKFVVEADAFTRRSIADVSLEALFTDGPFQGKSWIDIYKEMMHKRTLIGKMRYIISDLEFKTICLESLEAHGKCYVSSGGTDCDSCSYGYCHSFDSLEEAEAYKERTYESADGVVHVSAMTKEEYDSFESYSHDLALAAFEDGHPHSVSEADWNDRY